METASIRIKFTPLLNKTLKNGSKCCLEIVPEVSYVQNLDKISWKQEKDLIEYTIPMTYRIILKKRENAKKIDDDLPDMAELDKTYHSCVDLLPPSSMTTFDMGSGDVTRIISDTYIIGNISAKFYDDKPAINYNLMNDIKAQVTELHPNGCAEEIAVHNHIIHEQTVFDDDREDKENYLNDNATTRSLSDVINKHSLDKITNTDIALTGDGEDNKDNLNDDATTRPLCDVINKHSLDKITNTDTALTVSKVTGTESIETITEISTSSRDDSKRKLTLTPICSIDTKENPFTVTDEKNPLNLVIDRVFRYETRDFSEKLPKRNEKHINLTTLTEDYNMSIGNIHIPCKRELPSDRVAKFIKKMETEIMPLKMMLNDILQKCSALNLSKNTCIKQSLILYKLPSCNIPSFKNQVEKYGKIEKPKSNRVVYSIVFDG